MAADPDLDALIPAGGGGDPLQGAIAAVERAGKTSDIDIVSTDFLPDLGERLENGSMAGESGGHYCDPLISFMRFTMQSKETTKTSVANSKMFHSHICMYHHQMTTKHMRNIS